MITHTLEKTEVREDGSEWEYGKTYDDGTYFSDWIRLIKYPIIQNDLSFVSTFDPVEWAKKPYTEQYYDVIRRFPNVNPDKTINTERQLNCFRTIINNNEQNGYETPEWIVTEYNQLIEVN